MSDSITSEQAEIQKRKEHLFQAIVLSAQTRHQLKQAWHGNEADFSYSMLESIQTVALAIDNEETRLKGTENE